MKLSLRTKLILPFVTVLLLMGLAAGIIVTQFSAVNQLSQQNYRLGLVGIRLISEAIAEGLRSREQLLHLTITTSAEEQLRQRQRIEEHTTRMLAQIEAYKPLIETRGAQAAMADFEAVWAEYTGVREQVMRLVLVGNRAEAASLFRSEGEAQLDEAINLLVVLQGIEDKLAQARFEESQALFQTANYLALAVALSAILAGVGQVFWLNWVVIRPVGLIAQTASQVAEGNLNRVVPVAENNDDELGILARAFNSMTAQLRDLINSLEQQVANRTERLKVVATLGERLSAILDLQELLTEIVSQIHERFGYYYAHIYLLDDAGEKLVAAAGVGEAGAVMKAREHSILLNTPTSLIARAARTGEIVRVDNVRETPNLLPNPLLPDTYSEMAVPITLGVEGRVIGVLDVQQDRIAGLDEGDANLLRSLANHVAVAIRNARLFAEVQTALAEARTTQERYLERAWGSDNGAKQHGAYHYQQSDAPLLDEVIMSQFEQETLGRDRAAVVKVKADETERAALVAPIKLQSQVIGSIQLHDADPSRQWSEWELALIESVTDQAAQVAENLRLFEETRERATREQTIREITERMRAATSLEELVETTAHELGERLSAGRAKVELGLEPETHSSISVSNRSDNG